MSAQAGGTPTGEAEINKTRKLVMVQAHLIAIVPLEAAFLARGYGR